MENKYSVNLHISNSGINFSVVDVGHGPTLEIHSSAFGNMSQTLKIHTDKQSLISLAKMLLEAAKDDYSKEYCHKATNK